MTLALVPLLQWAAASTLITRRDLFRVIAPLLVSVGIGGAAALAVRPTLESIESTFLRLAVESSVFFGGYLLSLLFVMKQMLVYQEALKDVGLWPIRKFWRVLG